MILAYNKIIPSEEWIHDKYLSDNKNNTVAMILAYNRIIPPS